MTGETNISVQCSFHLFSDSDVNIRSSSLDQSQMADDFCHLGLFIELLIFTQKNLVRIAITLT